VPRPGPGRSGQARPSRARQNANDPQMADEIHRARHPQPWCEARTHAGQCSNPPAQAPVDVHRAQPQLTEDPAVHLRLFQTGQERDTGYASGLRPPYRAPLILDQLVGPVLSAACRHRCTHQARPWILAPRPGLAQQRLPGVGNVTNRVQRERHSMLAAPRLPKAVAGARLSIPPARTMNPAVARYAGQALQAPVRHPCRHHPAGFITTILDDDESRPGRTTAGRGILLQLASALRGRAGKLFAAE
jgi:hypothetical protein